METFFLGLSFVHERAVNSLFLVEFDCIITTIQTQGLIVQ